MLGKLWVSLGNFGIGHLTSVLQPFKVEAPQNKYSEISILKMDIKDLVFRAEKQTTFPIFCTNNLRGTPFAPNVALVQQNLPKTN